MNVDFLMDMNEIEGYYIQNGIKYEGNLRRELNLDGDFDLDEYSNFRMKLIIK